MKYFALVGTLHYLTVSFFVILVSTSDKKFTPFTYPRLYQIVDPRVGMEYFCKKLGVEGFISDRLLLKHAMPYLNWQKELEILKESTRNIDACSLLKVEPRARAFDTVGKKGDRECLKQCQMESETYYQYLNDKLQNLTHAQSFDEVEVRLIQSPTSETSWETKKFYKCVKKGYKRFVCRCYHPEYIIEATEEFKKKFHKIVQDLYGLTPSPEKLKLLEERHRTPLKLVGFLITCHLLPTEIFSFLVWWDATDNPSSYVYTTTTPVAISEDCETISLTDESEEEKIEDTLEEDIEKEIDDEEEEEEEKE